jgi:hypothetical protein
LIAALTRRSVETRSLSPDFIASFMPSLIFSRSNSCLLVSLIAGLDPAIQPAFRHFQEVLDARVKPGHEGEKVL